jgi:diguanylate cyclase (GGDEF)-like protein
MTLQRGVGDTQPMPDAPLFSVGAVLLCAVAVILSAALLWAGAGVAQLAQGRSKRLANPLTGAAVGLVAIGVWWPGHLLSSGAGMLSSGGLGFIVSVLLAGLVAAGARITTDAARESATPRFALAGLVTWALTLAHAILAAPVLSSVFGPWTPLAFGVLAVTLSAALVVVHLERDLQRGSRLLRLAVPVLAAVLLTAGPALSSAALQAEATGRWSDMAAITAIALLGAVLVLLLKDEGRRGGVAAEPREQTLRAPASVDGLTRLPTRVQFEDQLAAQIARCDASRSRLALLFVDLDGFKPVNDTFGHSSGDVVLKQVGERLKAVLRAGDMVGRIGGDEFVLMVTGSPTDEAVAQVAKRVIDEVSRPYEIDGRGVGISCSIGIVFYPDSGAHTKLIARADAAMYAAKRSGGSCYSFYVPSMDEDARDKFELTRDLREALDNDEMELFYQPKIDTKSGKVTAAEALLRWKHPKRGMVPPDVFIPLAERFGLIGSLGNWVIEEACRQARLWREHGLRMRLAINLSAHQLRQPDIVQRMEEALERHRIHPSLLTCEITESVAMEDTKATQATFLRLGTAGIHLSIDDFGTGYSSLSYLRRLPAEELKIDRTFVMDIENSADARAVVDAVIRLAHALSLRVVAEGVENQRQHEILSAMGCDEMQGYLFAKPMSARALLLWAIDDRPHAFRDSLFGDTMAIN